MCVRVFVSESRSRKVCELIMRRGREQGSEEEVEQRKKSIPLEGEAGPGH